MQLAVLGGEFHSSPADLALIMNSTNYKAQASFILKINRTYKL